MWIQLVAPLVAALFIALTIKQKNPIVNFLVNLRNKILPKGTLKYVENIETPTTTVIQEEEEKENVLQPDSTAATETPQPPPTTTTVIQEEVKEEENIPQTTDAAETVTNTEKPAATSQQRTIDEKPLSHIESSIKVENLDLSSHIARLNARATNETLPPLSLELDETLGILQQLSEFELGRFMLQNRGLNGYWTKYIIVDGPKVDPDTLNAVERWMLFRAPLVLATQERFKIFQEKIQSRITRDKMKLASIPCGLMDDLLSLDYSAVSGVKLEGIDIDGVSISHAHQNAFAKRIRPEVEFHRRNAWNVGIQDLYDVVTSNGLNVYEPDNEKVAQLYAQFYKALKEGGTLVTSFLVPPSTWVMDETDAAIQKCIFTDIFQSAFMIFRTEDETRRQLESVGFTVLEVIYHKQHIFPTIVAEKRAK